MLRSGRLVRFIGSRLPAFLLLCLALALKLGEPRALQHLRLSVFDLYQRIAPRPYVEAGVRIVDLDDASLARIGQWPWSRLRVAELVRRLDAAGVAAVGFDMVFAEADRLSASGVAQDLAGLLGSERLERLAEALPASDADLAAALAELPSVLGFVLVEQPTERRPARRWGFGSAGDDPRRFLRPFAGVIANLPELEAAAPGNGSFNAVPDADGTIRRAALLFRLGDEIVPSLSMELLRVAQGASTYLVKSSGSGGSEGFGRASGITAVKIGAIAAETDAQGAIWLHFTGPRAERFVPAWQVLDGSADPRLLRGHIVLVGTSAAGLKDQRASPLDPAGPGVELHAQALEQLLLGIRLVRPDWAVGAEFVFILLLGGLLVILMPKLSPGICLASGVVALAIAFTGSFAAFREAGLLLDPMMPAGGVLLIYLAGSYSGYVRTEAERSRVRQAFAHYLAPEMVETLARSGARLQLGGELRELTVMFTDIRRFSTLSQRLTPTELTGFLNRFFTPMTGIIQAHRGTIDKYIGDCIMAFWNAPLDDPHHALHACRAALAMLRATQELETQLRQQDRSLQLIDYEFRIGIGLCTGTSLVGNMGSEQRFNYSAIGYSVNLAQRIESQCKVYGVGLLVSGSTADAVPGLALLEVERVLLPGSEAPTLLHALVGDEATAESEGFRRWQAAHATYRRLYLAGDFAAAGEQALLARRLSDTRHRPLYDYYRRRCTLLADQPPAADWDGVTVSHEK